MVAFFFPLIAVKPNPNYEFLSEEEYSGFSSTPSFSSVDLGDATTNRVIVVALSWFASSSRTLSSATINGVAASIVQQGSDGDEGSVGIISAIVPTGTSGTIALTFSGTVTRVSGGVYALYNLQSTTAIDSDAQSGQVIFGIGGNRSVTIDTLADGVVIAAGGVSENGGTTTIGYSAGVSEDYENVSGDFRANGGSGVSSSTSMTVTMTATNDGFTEDDCYSVVVAASWR